MMNSRALESLASPLKTQNHQLCKDAWSYDLNVKCPVPKSAFFKIILAAIISCLIIPSTTNSHLR